MSEGEPFFRPPRGGRGSQAGDDAPPSAFWQPPESLPASSYWAYREGGLLLGWADGFPVGVKDDRHVMTIAGARAGKTSTLLIPNLLLYPGSALVLDPKGELAAATAAHRRAALGQYVHVLDPWGVADCPADLKSRFDPLAELSGGDRKTLIDDAALVAEALILDQGENNAHWTGAARDFVRAVVLWLICDPQAPDPNLADLLDLITQAMGTAKNSHDDSGPEGLKFLAVMAAFEDQDDTPREAGDAIRLAGDGMLATPPKERNSILSTARNQLGFLASAQMRENLATSSLRLRDLKRQGVTVYLVLPATRMTTHAKWLRLILNLAIAALEDTSIKKPELPVLFMLEEFAALGHMRALEQASAYMAGFGVKLWVVLQDLPQLKRHYKEGWESFLANQGVLVAFANSDATTLEYVSKMLGETFVYIEESHQQGTSALAAGAPSTRENFQRVPLMAPHEISRLFGRHRMLCLAKPADGPPIALQREYVGDHGKFLAKVRDAMKAKEPA